MAQVVVLGIDPGLSLTGYACVAGEEDSDSPSRLIEAGVFRLKQGRTLGERLVELERDLSGILRRLRPGLVCVEAVFAHPVHPRTAISMAHARGVIMLGAARADLPLVELPPATVKKALTGNGRAGKAQVQSAVAVQLGLASLPEPHDVADAIAVALCGLRRCGSMAPANGRARKDRGRLVVRGITIEG